MTTPHTNEPSALEDSIRAILSGDHQRLEQSFDAIVKESAGAEPRDLRDAWQAFEGDLLAHFDAEEAQVLPLFARAEPKEARSSSTSMRDFAPGSSSWRSISICTASRPRRSAPSSTS